MKITKQKYLLNSTHKSNNTTYLSGGFDANIIQWYEIVSGERTPRIFFLKWLQLKNCVWWLRRANVTMLKTKLRLNCVCRSKVHKLKKNLQQKAARCLCLLFSLTFCCCCCFFLFFSFRIYWANCDLLLLLTVSDL